MNRRRVSPSPSKSTDRPSKSTDRPSKSTSNSKAARVRPSKSKTRKVSAEDVPVLEEWVLASEAAEIAHVSRQYLHNSLHLFPLTRKMSGFLVFNRAEVEAWAARRAGEWNNET